jgi:hypothetical protein
MVQLSLMHALSNGQPRLDCIRYAPSGLQVGPGSPPSPLSVVLYNPHLTRGLFLSSVARLHFNGWASNCFQPRQTPPASTHAGCPFSHCSRFAARLPAEQGLLTPSSTERDWRRHCNPPPDVDRRLTVMARHCREQEKSKLRLTLTQRGTRDGLHTSLLARHTRHRPFLLDHDEPG